MLTVTEAATTTARTTVPTAARMTLLSARRSRSKTAVLDEVFILLYEQVYQLCMLICSTIFLENEVILSSESKMQ